MRAVCAFGSVLRVRGELLVTLVTRVERWRVLTRLIAGIPVGVLLLFVTAARLVHGHDENIRVGTTYGDLLQSSQRLWPQASQVRVPVVKRELHL